MSESPSESAKYEKAIRIEAAFCTKRENLYKVYSEYVEFAEAYFEKKKNEIDKKMGAFLLAEGRKNVCHSFPVCSRSVA